MSMQPKVRPRQFLLIVHEAYDRDVETLYADYPNND